MATTLTKQINIATYFLTAEYVLKTRVKFYVNRMLFTIRSLDLFFMYNFKLQNSKFKHLIDDIAIDLFSS